MQTHSIWAAYVSSDPFGKLIFLLLFALSVATWTLISWKGWQLRQARRSNRQFESLWLQRANDPLAIGELGQHLEAPALCVYRKVREETGLLLQRGAAEELRGLSAADISLVAGAAAAQETQILALLDAHLYLLSVGATLAPFLGLLGTVWGILQTLQSIGDQGSSHTMLAGLGTALATTVLGLVIAIPARLGYSVLKQQVHQLEVDSERFSQLLLARIEFAYRQ